MKNSLREHFTVFNSHSTPRFYVELFRRVVRD